ncbi:MAG: polysaccharide deacetylase family protein [Acidobacteriales bacterium]|nr:polysaccharide deacetylase family protein [Terriglobales bacterium]
MESLKRFGAHVLPLAEALRRLAQGTLPAKAVVITFDDGNVDFYRCAYPILREYGFPATVYQTTFYSADQRPVFDVVCPYILWKAGKHNLELAPVIGRNGRFDLANEESRRDASREILHYAFENRLSAEQKDEIVTRLAVATGVDHEEIRKRRLLHLMNQQELRELVAAGVDVELHTHRHRTPDDEALFMRELADNREALHGIGQDSATQFCYPCGVHRPSYLPWLRDAGVQSATTCQPGMASRRHDTFLLPRLVDTMALSPEEFEGWLSGVSAFLPRRKTQSPETLGY